MGLELTTTQLAIIVLGGIAGLIGFVVGSRIFNAMFLLTAGYLVLSPLSAANELPGGTVVFAKYVRVAVTLMTVFTGVMFFRALKIRPTIIIFGAFVGIYVFSGLWSDIPTSALKYKGLYGAAVLSGFLTAYAVRSFDDLTRGIRPMILASGVWCLIVFGVMAANPASFSNIGRLWVLGLNPNRVGQTIAPMMILCGYTALYDPKKLWKIIAYGTGTAIVLIVFYTASRGAAGMAFIGCFILGLPLVKRPGLLALLLVLCVIPVYLMLSSMEGSEADAARLTIANLDTRDKPWTEALAYFREKPFLGQGWVYNIEKREGGSTANMHSIYMQTLAECGIVGVAIMVPSLLMCLGRGARMFFILRRDGRYKEHAYFGLALTGAVLAHGFIEAGTLMGGTINAVMLGVGLGLFDRLPELLQEERELIDSLDEDERLEAHPVDHPHEQGGEAEP